MVQETRFFQQKSNKRNRVFSFTIVDFNHFKTFTKIKYV